MPSTLNRYLLLAALLQGILGAPADVAPTENLAGDPSGEEGELTSDLLSASGIWERILSLTDNHPKEFEAEFQNQVKYHMLEDYNISSLPESCSYYNLSKEACLQKLARGLFIYKALLKHVEKEYPSNSKILDARLNCGRLIALIKENMKHPERVTELTSTKEEQLLKEINSPYTFQRRMTAHSILFELRNFLLKGKRAIKKKEKAKGSMEH
ncbi:interleukin-6-like [Notolabrus celidotus]|uniref:interleukin-6-like n=1 Tax=Notolabrus celidotus TaxID=1203425 RepID=UPI00149029C7|nr:interleukin-6-like [Notolabrus celidotus]